MPTLFDPVVLGGLRTRNRIVMAPMTRRFSPGGIRGEDVKAYYVRRAESVARALLSDSQWVEKVRQNDFAHLRAFSRMIF